MSEPEEELLEQAPLPNVASLELIKNARLATEEDGLVVKIAPIDAFLNDPKNVRVHGKSDLNALRASLRKFDQQKPIVVDNNGIVVAGNGTLIAAQAEGWEEIKFVQTKLEGSAARAYAIADNRTAELSKWDYEGLALEMHTLQDDGFDINILGFDEDDMLNIMGAEDFGGGIVAGDIENDYEDQGGFSPTMYFTKVEKGICKQAIAWFCTRNNIPENELKDGTAVTAMLVMVLEAWAGCEFSEDDMPDGMLKLIEKAIPES